MYPDYIQTFFLLIIIIGPICGEINKKQDRVFNIRERLTSWLSFLWTRASHLAQSDFFKNYGQTNRPTDRVILSAVRG